MVAAVVMSHMILHRAQLVVYLRLLDVPVPAIYGPSADEGGFWKTGAARMLGKAIHELTPSGTKVQV